MLEQVYTQAKLLAGVEETQQLALLRVLCQAAVTALTARLREGLLPENCAADFMAAASLLALAAFLEADPMSGLRKIQLADVTLEPGSSAGAQCLRKQAEGIMLPYCVSGFSFVGV